MYIVLLSEFSFQYLMLVLLLFTLADSVLTLLDTVLESNWMMYQLNASRFS